MQVVNNQLVTQDVRVDERHPGRLPVHAQLPVFVQLGIRRPSGLRATGFRRRAGRKRPARFLLGLYSPYEAARSPRRRSLFCAVFSHCGRLDRRSGAGADRLPDLGIAGRAAALHQGRAVDALVRVRRCARGVRRGAEGRSRFRDGLLGRSDDFQPRRCGSARLPISRRRPSPGSRRHPMRAAPRRRPKRKRTGSARSKSCYGDRRKAGARSRLRRRDEADARQVSGRR